MLWITLAGIYQKVREHVQSHLKKSSREAVPLIMARRVAVGSLTHPQTGMSSDEDWSAGELGEEKDNGNDEESSSSSDEISLDASDLE